VVTVLSHQQIYCVFDIEPISAEVDDHLWYVTSHPGQVRGLIFETS